jgi:hypothetical protein
MAVLVWLIRDPAQNCPSWVLPEHERLPKQLVAVCLLPTNLLLPEDKC